MALNFTDFMLALSGVFFVALLFGSIYQYSNDSETRMSNFCADNCLQEFSEMPKLTACYRICMVSNFPNGEKYINVPFPERKT